MAAVSGWFDRCVIDRTVDGVGGLPWRLGTMLRALQTGMIQFYAVAMALGLKCACAPSLAGVAEGALPVMREIWQILEPLGIELGEATEFGGPDLIPLRAAGMAVLGLRQDGTNYFDLHHTADDTFDKVDAKSLDQNVAAYAAFAYLAAEYEGRFDAPKDTAEATEPDHE